MKVVEQGGPQEPMFRWHTEEKRIYDLGSLRNHYTGKGIKGLHLSVICIHLQQIDKNLTWKVNVICWVSAERTSWRNGISRKKLHILSLVWNQLPSHLYLKSHVLYLWYSAALTSCSKASGSVCGELQRWNCKCAVCGLFVVLPHGNHGFPPHMSEQPTCIDCKAIICFWMIRSWKSDFCPIFCKNTNTRQMQKIIHFLYQFNNWNIIFHPNIFPDDILMCLI